MYKYNYSTNKWRNECCYNYSTEKWKKKVKSWTYNVSLRIEISKSRTYLYKLFTIKKYNEEEEKRIERAIDYPGMFTLIEKKKIDENENVIRHRKHVIDH